MRQHCLTVWIAIGRIALGLTVQGLELQHLSLGEKLQRSNQPPPPNMHNTTMGHYLMQHHCWPALIQPQLHNQVPLRLHLLLSRAVQHWQDVFNIIYNDSMHPCIALRLDLIRVSVA